MTILYFPCKCRPIFPPKPAQHLAHSPKGEKSPARAAKVRPRSPLGSLHQGHWLQLTESCRFSEKHLYCLRKEASSPEERNRKSTTTPHLFPGPDLPSAASHLAIPFSRKERPHQQKGGDCSQGPPPPSSSLPSPALQPHCPTTPPRGVRDRRPLPHPPRSSSLLPPIIRVSRTLCDSGNSSDVRLATSQGGGRRCCRSRGGGSCLSGL